MNFSIEPDHHLKIIRYKHSGHIKEQDLGMAWEKLLQMKEFVQEGYNLLSDYRDAIFDMKIDEVYEIVDTLEKMGPILDGKKQSIIVQDPYSTAGSILFEEISQRKLKFRIKIFSTDEAALHWLSI